MSDQNSRRCWRGGEKVIVCWFLVVLIGVHAQNDTLDFLDKCQRDCAIQRSFSACARFRAARWLNDFVQQEEVVYGPFKVIKIPTIRELQLPKVQGNASNSLVVETLKFLRNSANELVTRRALVYTVEEPRGARSTHVQSGMAILDDDELDRMQRKGRAFFDEGSFRLLLHKKKKHIFLTFLMLINLIKIKLLLIPVVLGIHMIKKLILIGALFLPAFLAQLRICKAPYHSFHIPWGPVEPPVDYN